MFCFSLKSFLLALPQGRSSFQGDADRPFNDMCADMISIVQAGFGSSA